MPGVVRISTGAWWDPTAPGEPDSLDKHGNPNVLTGDVGASRLSHGCAAQSCLVELERFEGAAPPVTAFDLPRFELARTQYQGKREPGHPGDLPRASVGGKGRTNAVE